MDEAKREPEKQRTDPDTQEALQSLPGLQREKQPELETSEPKEHKYGVKEKARALAHKLWERIERMAPHAGLHDWIMVVFTGVLTAVAIEQGILAWQNSQSSTLQMGKIIDAANRIEDAADSFSASAARINQGVFDAVTQLGIQAGASKTQAGASETLAGITAKQFSFNQQIAESQRAAISVELYEVVNPVTFHDRGLSMAFSALLINNGQIRAIDTVVRFKPSYIQWGTDEFTEPAKRQAALCDKPPTADEVKQAKESPTGDVIFAGAHKDIQIGSFGDGSFGDG